MEDKFKVLREAERYVVDRQYDKAVHEYRKLLDYQGEDPGILNTLGDLLLKSGKADEAIGLFERAGEIFAQGGFVTKSIAVYKKIDTYRPGNREIVRRLVDLNSKRGLKSETSRYLRQLAALQRSSNDLQGALDSLRRLSEYRSSDASVQRELAQTEEAVGDPHAALRHYVTAARLFLEDDRPQEAYECAEEALKIDGDSSEAMELMLTAGSRRAEAAAEEPPEPVSEIEELPEELEAAPPVEPDFATAPPRELEEEQTDLEPVSLREQETAPVEEGVTDLAEFSEEGPPPVPAEEVETETVPPPPDVEPRETESEVDEFDFEELFESDPMPETPGEELPDEVRREPVEEDSDELAEFFPAGETGEAEEIETFAEASEPEEEEESVGEAPSAPAANLAEVDDMLEEVDFYLKLDLRHDAEALLEKLREDHPDHPGIRERVRILGLDRIVGSGEAAGAASDEKSFETEVESALEELFFEEAPPGGELEEPDIAPGPEPAVTEDDPQAQYDLGLAYREMGMLQDAAEKFELSHRLFLEQDQLEHAQRCVPMLTSSYLRLEDYEKVVTWADKGLESNSVQGFERKALEYDRAQALEMMGQVDESREGYRRILDEDPGFRDVEDRLARLS